FGGRPAPSQATITLPGGRTRTFTVSDGGRPVSIVFTLPPGDSVLRLQTRGPAAPNPPGNVRDLRLRVVAPKIEDPGNVLLAPRYVAAATP
ncbi:MAG: hypothetical protein ACRDMZ_06230, partial [Solirubrobacteraceae bacterium]